VQSKLCNAISADSARIRVLWYETYVMGIIYSFTVRNGAKVAWRLVQSADGEVRIGPEVLLMVT
jgi:hypothetical protein